MGGVSLAPILSSQARDSEWPEPYQGHLPPPLRTRDFTLMPDVFFFMG